jgi:YHS domain-containing protein
MRHGVLSLLVACLLLAGLTGCRRQQAPPPPQPAPSGGTAAEGLGALRPEDRALAEKQGTCPVSGEKLGSMGTPFKVTARGRTVFLCCDKCQPKFEADVDKYLAEIEGGQSEAQK